MKLFCIVCEYLNEILMAVSILPERLCSLGFSGLKINNVRRFAFLWPPNSNKIMDFGRKCTFLLSIDQNRKYKDESRWSSIEIAIDLTIFLADTSMIALNWNHSYRKWISRCDAMHLIFSFWHSGLFAVHIPAGKCIRVEINDYL